jgi:uncharacterized membrane protein YeiB
MEAFMSVFMLLFGLGFFLFVMHIIQRETREDKRESWERRMMEAREFGFGGKDKHNVQSLHQKDD